MIVIVGGTGTMGSSAARQLLAEREAVRIVTRSRERAEALGRMGAEIVDGNLLDRESMIRACKGATGVLSAAHSIFGRGKHASVHVDGRGHRDLIDAAREAGVHHFVYTSVFDFGGAYRSIPFIRIKYETEKYLSSSGLAHTILRPTVFMQPHAHALIGVPVVRKGRVVLFGSGRVRRNFVAPEDVARVAVASLRDPSLAGETVDVGGPENLTDLDVVRIYERLSGRTAKVRHVPIPLVRWMSVIARRVHSGVGQVLRMAVLGQSEGQMFDADSFSKRFGFAPARLERWAAERLSREAGVPSQ
jgi:uncharacterized protein YbjT (DUF2867 family)